MASDQQKLQSLIDSYQKLQTDLQATITARQKLESQVQENKGVQKEFNLLPPTSQIYKLVGPVLLKQERSEAVMAVEGRLEFIEKEMYDTLSSYPPDSNSPAKPRRELVHADRRTDIRKRIESQIQNMQEESESKKMEVYHLQTQLQSQQGGAVS